MFHKVKAPAHGSLELRAIGHVGLPGNLLVQSFCFLLYHGTSNRHIMPVLPVHIPCKHPDCGLKNKVLRSEGVPYGCFSLVASNDFPYLVLTFEDMLTPYFQARWAFFSPCSIA